MKGISVKLPKKTTQGMTFSNEDMRLAFKTDFATVDNMDINWMFTGRTEISKRLGGYNGISTLDTFISDDGQFKITREFWRGTLLHYAMRYIFENLSGKDMAIGKIRVFSASGSKITLSGSPQTNVRAFLDRAEPMDCIPSAVRLADFDETYITAAAGAVWDMEETAKVKKARPHALAFENFCMLDGGSDSMPKLLIGFIELAHHYTDMEITTDAARKKIDYITADAVFDCVLPSGGERATQFLAFITARTHNKALDAYTDMTGHASGVPSMPSALPPSVGCTWHYYGSFINEKTVLENIKAKQTRGIPLDVYMIDDFWEPLYGDWHAVETLFPHGMRFMADSIREAGMRPGIWTAPFAVNPKSETAKRHSEMLFRTKDGELAKFFGDYMIDPTAPGAMRWLEDLYKRLHDDYGFEYFKLDKVDFPHRAWRSQNPVCHDRSVTLVEAYRMALAKIREAVGQDSFICVCGGHYGASIGLCDTQRSSGDTYGKWGYESKKKFVPTQEFRLKQTLGRLHYRRLWLTNADGMEIRRQKDPLDKKDFGLSVGMMTDDEARLMTITHYITGGIVMCGESLVNIDDERLKLYRHVLPSVNTISRAVDLFHPWLPTQFVTQIIPRCAELGRWNTISIINVSSKKMNSTVLLDGDVTNGLSRNQFLLFELVGGTFMGWGNAGSSVRIKDIPPHAGRILKIIEADSSSRGIFLLGTDLHNSGGGVEISQWKQESSLTLSGKLDTAWTSCPVQLTAFCMSDTVFAVKTIELPPGVKDFFFDFR